MVWNWRCYLFRYTKCSHQKLIFKGLELVWGCFFLTESVTIWLINIFWYCLDSSLLWGFPKRKYFWIVSLIEKRKAFLKISSFNVCRSFTGLARKLPSSFFSVLYFNSTNIIIYKSRKVTRQIFRLGYLYALENLQRQGIEHLPLRVALRKPK